MKYTVKEINEKKPKDCCLTAIGFEMGFITGKKARLVKTVCRCGNEKTISTSLLISGGTKSCGCLLMMNPYKKNYLKGMRFGNLLVGDFFNNGQTVLWDCKCDCGTIKHYSTSQITTGRVKSCGCQKSKRNNGNKYRVTHNMSKTGTYKSYRAMKTRCLTPNSFNYKNYGGRGIKVCERWVNSFENFLLDMGERPKGYTLDRKNSNLDYSKENCRWATTKQQGENKRGNRFVIVNGERLCLKLACEKYGSTCYVTFYGRISRGWELMKALNTPNKLNNGS